MPYLPSFSALVLSPFSPGGEVVREGIDDLRSSVSKLKITKQTKEAGASAKFSISKEVRRG